LNGSFTAPIKKMSEQWEDTWLLFAFSGLLVFPWMLTLATVPNLEDAFRGAPFATVVRVALFGVAWGVGSALLGVGVARVGIALGFALILGITASFGSFFPLAILHP
jgi:L-rhamnose-H+ transport protein